MRELAAQFGISRGTGRPTPARPRYRHETARLPADEVPEAARLYGADWSLARIAEMFGTTDDTVRHT